jgi:phage gp46-like protein
MAKTPIKQSGSRGTNLSLDKAIKRLGKRIAKERYGNKSLTWLVERLLAKEIAAKRGGAHRVPAISKLAEEVS